jgi:tetratricopeptide (TPR) repeat protein
MSKYIPYLVFFLLSFILLGNSLNNGYSLDDSYVIHQQEYPNSPAPITHQGVKAIPKIFTSKYAKSGEQEHGYRPITLTSFAFEYELFGMNPTVSHFLNILLYALCISVLYLTLKTLFRDYNSKIAFITCLVFLLHPVHFEVVNNVKCRDELLSFLFAFSAFYFILKAFDQKRRWYYLLAGCLFLLSLLSKHGSITFLGIIPIALYFFRDINIKKLTLATGGILGTIVLFYLMKKQLATGEGISRTAEYYENPYHHNYPGFLGAIPFAAYNVMYYFKLFLAPFPLISYYGYSVVVPKTWGDPIAIFSIFMVLGMLYLVYKSFEKNRILSFGMIYFLVCISIFSNLIKPAPGIIAERFMFLSSVGLCIAFAWGLTWLFKESLAQEKNKYTSSGIWLTLILIALICLPYSWTRSKDWTDLETLIAADLEKAPESVKLNTLFAGMQMKKLYPGNPLSHQEKIAVFKTAIRYNEEALELFPEHHIAMNNLGTLYLKSNQAQKGYRMYHKAIKVAPDYHQGYASLGDFFSSYKQLDSAKYYFEKALELRPKNQQYQQKTQYLEKALNP